MVSDLSGETTKKGQKFNFYFESEISKKQNVTFVIFTNGP